MGNVLLARILEYFNGTLFLDDNYRFCVFFIENYIDFYKTDEHSCVPEEWIPLS